ncbi:MAG: hypothetical protein ACXV8Q_01955 [Methylobacter sp.]
MRLCSQIRDASIKSQTGQLVLIPQTTGRQAEIPCTPSLIEPLRRIWFASDQLCSKRLKAALPLWLPHYESEYGVLSETVRGDLLKVSAATLDRLLKPLRIQHYKGLSGTKPGSLLNSNAHYEINPLKWRINFLW